MDCAQTRTALHPYLDAELDDARAHEFERHLEGCPACTALLDQQRALSRALRQVIPRPAPPALRARILSGLAVPGKPRGWQVAMRPLYRTGAIAATILITWFIARAWYAPASEERMVREVVALHVRSLLPGHLTDVVSSDHHTVKPWFTGRLEFAPWVQDLSAQGYPLVGGRLEVMSGSRVAALVYQRRQHDINLLVRPSTASDALGLKVTSSEGYHIMSWSQDGRYFVAISDVAMADLEGFSDAVRQAP
jgi:anti-sigma factor (TIGR02949 family)